MTLAVIDTNIFINALFGRGFFRFDEKILDLEEQGIIKFGFSRHTLNELYKILARKIEENNIFECSEFYQLLHEIITRSKYIEAAPKIKDKLSSDPGDQYFIELAVTLRADYLVTNDKTNGLLKLGTYQEVMILTPEKLVKRIQSQTRKQTKI